MGIKIGSRVWGCKGEKVEGEVLEQSVASWATAAGATSCGASSSRFLSVNFEKEIGREMTVICKSRVEMLYGFSLGMLGDSLVCTAYVGAYVGWFRTTVVSWMQMALASGRLVGR